MALGCYSFAVWETYCLGQQLIDVTCQMGRLEALGIALERLAVGADEELLEVPGNVGALHRFPDDEFGVSHQTGGVVRWQRKLRLQIVKYLVAAFSIDDNLIKHDSFWYEAVAWSDVFQCVHYFFAIGIFLMTKLVRWKRQHGQLVSVLLAEIVHLREVTLGCAS